VRLSFLGPSLPSPFPGTAHGCSPLFTWDHRLKPGSIPVTWCRCVWCFTGTPLHSGNALGLFPTLVFHCGEAGITTESSYHPKAFLTDSNHGLAIPTYNEDIPSFQTGCSTGYRVVNYSKAAYGRTETFELHNRQLPCPRIPLPFIQFAVRL